MDQVNESLRAVASFVVENTSDEQKRLAFFPGHYDTLKVVAGANEGENHILRTKASALVAAGYQCDEVADDFNRAVESEFTFKVAGKSARRSKIYYLRQLFGKKARIAEDKTATATTTEAK